MLGHAALVLVMSLVAAEADETGQDEDLRTKIKSLQVQRVQTLERGIELAIAQYVEGMTDLNVFLALQLELLDAKLATAGTLDDEIQVLKSHLEVVKQTLNMVTARYEQGKVSKLDVIRAKSAALRIEVQLLTRQLTPMQGSD
jgi:archaellum component FlaC